METDYFADYYLERTISASKKQGIDDLIKALKKRGVKATSEQTGGFIMCAYIELKGEKYIYANAFGAGVYSKKDEEHEQDLYYNYKEENQEARIKKIAQVIAKWIKDNQ